MNKLRLKECPENLNYRVKGHARFYKDDIIRRFVPDNVLNCNHPDQHKSFGRGMFIVGTKVFQICGAVAGALTDISLEATGDQDILNAVR